MYAGSDVQRLLDSWSLGSGFLGFDDVVFDLFIFFFGGGGGGCFGRWGGLCIASPVEETDPAEENPYSTCLGQDAS